MKDNAECDLFTSALYLAISRRKVAKVAIVSATATRTAPWPKDGEMRLGFSLHVA